MAPTWIETDTNTNVNISSATAVGVYTSTGDKFVMPQLLADQVAGSGDYVYHVTLQVGGAGSAYVIGPKTTHTAAASETAIGAQGGFIAVRSGDVVTVYVDGLAGDTTTPDVTVRWFELDASANVTMQQGVAVAAADANGNVPANIRAVKSNLAAADGLDALCEWYDAETYVPVLGQEIRDAMKLAPSAGAPAAGSVDAKLDDILTTIGSEIVEGTYTRDDILRIIAAALAGKTSGSGTDTVEILGLDGVTTRITATVSPSGNRTAMTLDGEVAEVL